MKSAIRGGFDAFSLANNHANDQGTKGINATNAVAESLNVAVSGLRKKENDVMVPTIIHKKGWTILFLSVTEILNSYDKAGKLVYYIPPTQAGREIFLQEISKFRKENPCDLFILSIHLNEVEYGRVVSKEKKEWFAQLGAAGVDVVWGHHPHVMQGWEQTTISGRPVLYLYSMGNFISGQRSSPNLGSPGAYREYTGDGVMMKVELVREITDAAGTVGINTARLTEMRVDPVAVTNFTAPDGEVVVKLFTRSFIDGLSPVLRAYYLKRYSLMSGYLPLLPVTPVTGILEK
jgi:poly-gamma-glutamate synthesis protein (capsule biosynthesis protein)